MGAITRDELMDVITQNNVVLLEAINKRFDEVDKRFEEVDKQFEGVNKQFAEVYRRFDENDKKFMSIDEEFVAVRTEMNYIYKDLKSDINDLRDEVRDRFNRLSTCRSHLELDDSVYAIEKVVEDHSVVIKIHTDQINELNDRVSIVGV